MMANTSEIMARAAAVLADAGLIPNELDASGKLVYCGTTYKEGGKAGRYRLHIDYPPKLWFCNYHSGEVKTVSLMRTGECQSMTYADKHKLSEKIKRREEKERQKRIQAIARAHKLYNSYEEIYPKTTPYLERKKVKAVLGLRRAFSGITHYKNDADMSGLLTVVPALNELGRVMTLEYIAPNGTKRFLGNAPKKGCFFPIAAADGRKDGPLGIAEGLATALSIHEATGFAVLCSFDAGNLEPVSILARRKYPNRQIVLCADNDK